MKELEIEVLYIIAEHLFPENTFCFELYGGSYCRKETVLKDYTFVWEYGQYSINHNKVPYENLSFYKLTSGKDNK